MSTAAAAPDALAAAAADIADRTQAAHRGLGAGRVARPGAGLVDDADVLRVLTTCPERFGDGRGDPPRWWPAGVAPSEEPV